jgi:biopolymer transport protein TolR
MRKNRDFVHAGSRPNSDINVTPLVDVVLVLLIIFMVVTPLLEKDIEIKVPDTEQSDDTDDVPPDQLVVGIDAQNNLSINSEKIAWGDAYIEKLKRQLAAKTGDKLVFFMADEKTNYRKVIEALDGARQAGAQILGMMTELADNKAPAAK